ncbi:Protein SYM1 [Candida viswanathii]|uniref:Protein SYM1 n=1 Tax=Candida viswanathii TaxID=5486 RepID=A0A367YPU6_9ASCO|nr:Protein SYM1 [Candida viswanathii]
MKHMFRRYNVLLKKHPFATNAVTTGILLGTGDVLAQFLFPQSPDQPFDYYRNLRAIVYGALIFAPVGDKWYKLLNTKIVWPGGGKNERTKSTILRVMADQLVFAPFIGIPLYYSAMTILENRQPFVENIVTKFETSWWTTLKGNWLVWPIFQFANFYLIPVEFRLMAVNVISIGWNTYLSYVMHNTK